MGNCVIEKATNARLKDLVKSFGQAEGLSRFLEESSDKKFAMINKIWQQTKGKHYAYSKEGADAKYSELTRVFDGYVVNKPYNTKRLDVRGNPIFVITVPKPEFRSKHDDPIFTRLEKPVYESTEEMIGRIALEEQNDNKLRFDDVSGEYYMVFDDEESSISPAVQSLLLHLKGQVRAKSIRYGKLNSEYKKGKREGVDTSEIEGRITTTRNELSILQDSIINLKSNQNSVALQTLAEQQLKWCESKLGSPTISASELTEIGSVIDMWFNARELMYSTTDDIDDNMKNALDAIHGLVVSNEVMQKWWNVTTAFMAKESGYQDPSMLRKELLNAKDIGIFTAYGLDLGSTGIKFITQVDKAFRDAQIRYEAEYDIKEKKIQSVFKKLKDKKLSYDKLWQVDSNGERTGELVNAYSQSFFSARKILLSSFYASVEAAGTDKLKIKNAIVKKNKWFNTNTVTIDIRFFVNPGFSDHRYKSKDDYIAFLEGQFGKTTAQSHIDDAMEQYAEYEKSLVFMKSELESAFIEGTITDTERDARLISWVSKNSPIAYLGSLYSADTNTISKNSQQYNKNTVNIPRKFDHNGKPTGWYDKNYEEIENNPELMETYMFIKEYMQEMMNYLPAYITKDLQSNFLPRVKKDLMQRLSSKDTMGILSGAGKAFMDSITDASGMDENLRNIDPNTGKPYKSPPVRYIGKLEIDERSDDLEAILAAFGQMALSYKYKSKVEDMAVLAVKLVDDIATSVERGNKTTDELANVRKLLEYTQDVMVYGKPKEDEGRTKIILDKAQKGRYEQIKRLRDILEERLEDGKITEAEYNSEMDELKKEADLLGVDLVWSKIGDKALKYNQLLSLGFNVFSAVNNYTFGVISNIVSASGRRDFTPKQMWTAYGMMWKSAFTLNDKKFDKVSNLIAKFRILEDSVEYKNSVSKNNTLEFLKNSPYIALKGGDFFIKGHTFISMMLNEKITDLNGQERSLYDAFDDEGNWKTSEFGDNKGYNGDITKDTEMQDFIKTRNKAVTLVKKLHGNFDPSSPQMAKKYILGRMVGQFRLSWMAEGFAQRFQGRQENEYLGRETEGRYRTYYNLGWRKSAKMLFQLATYQNSAAFADLKLKDRELVAENMQKNLMELYLYGMMSVIFLILKSSLEDGDEDDERNTKIALNMLWRSMADTTFYFSPATFIQLVNSPIPVAKVPIQFTKAITNATTLTFNSDELSDYEKKQKWMGITAAFPVLNQYNKFQYLGAKLR